VRQRGREPFHRESAGRTVQRTGAHSAPRPDGRREVAEEGQEWLWHTLRELREKAGRSGSEAARQVGMSQSRMSRIESGRFVPTEDEVTKLADLYHASAAMRRRLLRVVKDLRAEETPARVVLQRGAHRLQRRIATIEENAEEISGFATTVVPGLLQTADYARAVFAGEGELSAEEQDRSVAERVSRSAILEAGHRQIAMIMAEGALRWHAGSPQIMVEQLERLARLATGGRLQVGVIPWTQQVSVFNLHSFTMYDGNVVVVGTRAATAFITDPQDVAAYRTLFDELTAAASFGQAAADSITEIAAGYRRLA
jgi:transcriptional regulator with XRE-family HTH domain